MKKLGLALGSGGSRGIAHVGFLKALEEEELAPDYICGCSMGSIVGAAYAAGMSSDEIWTAVGKLRARDLIMPTRQKGGLFGTKKIRKILTDYLGETEFSELKIPFHCVAVDMMAQKLVFFSEGSVVDAIVASSSIPAVFHPTHTDGMRLVDGGVLERVPVLHTKEMGAEVLVAVDVLGQRACSENCPGLLGMLMQTIDVMDNERTKRYKKEHADIIDFWLEPDLGDMSPSSFKSSQLAYDKGYELGKEYAPKILEAVRE